MRFKLTVLFSFIFIFHLNSQTLNQVNSALESRGIETRSEILSELAKRGMSEDDARRMASVYGLSYDQYISRFVNNSTLKNNTSLPQPTTVNQVDIIQNEILEDKKISEKVENKIEQVEEKVAIENINDLNKSLKYYGYDIFLNNPYANKEYLVGNIDENYILAPGDVFRVYVFGINSYQAEVKIDLNGNVLLPEIGIFFASGYTFKTLKNRLTTFLGKSFSGLLEKPQKSFIDVSLSQLRPVKITVMGESVTPGPHLVNGFATVLNAIYSSGGIKSTGSLRNIQVIRNNRKIASIDLYEYLSKGRLDNDVRLMNDDIIFIPIRNNSVSLNGSVYKPSIFELNKGEGINELIEFAGGVKPSAYLDEVFISRIKNFEDRNKDDLYDKFLVSIDLGDIIKNKLNFNLNDGDNLVINSILDRKINSITLQGNVFRPGEYPLSKYNDLKQLIIDGGGGFRPRTYMEVADIIKENPFTGKFDYIKINLDSLMNDLIDYKLEDQDIIRIYSYNKDYIVDNKSRQELLPEKLNTVSIFGNVYKEGNYPLDKYNTLKELVDDAAMGIKPETYMEKVDVIREDLFTGIKSFKTFNLSNIMNGKENYNLEDNDEVRVYSEEYVYGEKKEISVSGFVSNPRVISWREDLNLYDLIFGSLSIENPDVITNILDSRVDIRRFNIETGLFFTNTYSLDKVFERELDISLLPRDKVILYSRSVFEEINPIVTSIGQLNNSGTFSLQDSMIVEDLIIASNGFKKFADQSYAIINRINIKDPEISRDKYQVKLDLNYILGLKKKNDVSNPFYLEDLDIVDVNILPGERESFSITINGEVNIPGKLILNQKYQSIQDLIFEFGGFTENAFLKSSYVLRNGKLLSYDLSKKLNSDLLKDDDQIIITSKLGEVTVNGAVIDTKIFNWEKRKVKYYIRNSGGKIPKKSGKIRINYSNGISKKVGFLKNPKTYPNSNIFVSFKEEKEDKSRPNTPFIERFIEVLTIATGALTTYVLANKL